MRTQWTYSLLILGLLLSAGCDRETEPAQSEPDQSDGRMTIVNDEARLAARLTIRNENVNIAPSLGKSSARQAFNLKLVAEIAPPSVGGTTLQATSVALDGNFAFISYAVAGSQAIGGVDVVQVKGGKNASIKSSVTFTDTDVNAVTTDGAFIFLAEATNNPAFDPLTAVAEKIPSNGGKLTLSGSVRRPVSSFVATSSAVNAGTLYVTTGNTGHLYRFNATTLAVTDSFALADARWVDADNTSIVVVQGTPGRLSVFNTSSGALTATYSFAGATIPESKSTVRIIGGKALIAAGDGGVRLINLATGTSVGSLPRVTVAGLDPSVTVTNAVGASGTYVFMSNGEAGIYVAQASQDLANMSGDTPLTLTTLGKLQFSSLQSVNHVAYDGSTLVIASGLGGVKVVDVTF